MTMILDLATRISAPSSMVLFDDTSGNVVHYAPREWRLADVNGVPQISYVGDQPSDVAFFSMILAPWFAPNELDDLKRQAAALGITVQPARYLGKSESGQQGTHITFPYEFPDDPRFRLKMNGGLGGAFGSNVPLVLSCSYTTGQILKKVAVAPGPGGKKGPGLVMQLAAEVRGATTSFHARITLDYDRTYELLSLHTSWNWWVWSGDIQAAWQDLQVSGAVKVELLGGTVDQKTIAYKMGEWLRDMFFKPELGNVTQPTHPNSGVINTSLRYEKQHEHKKFTIEFIERDFAEAPFCCAAGTGQIDIAAHTMSVPMAFSQGLLASVMDGIRPSFDIIPSYYVKDFLAARGISRLSDDAVGQV